MIAALAQQIGLIREAIRKLPVIAYALGLAAIGAAISIVRAFLPGVTYAGMFPIIGGFLVAMIVLLLVAAAAGNRNRLGAPAQALVWAVCLFIIVFLFFTVTAVAFGWPPTWRQILIPASRPPIPTSRHPTGNATANTAAAGQPPAVAAADPIKFGPEGLSCSSSSAKNNEVTYFSYVDIAIIGEGTAQQWSRTYLLPGIESGPAMPTKDGYARCYAPVSVSRVKKLVSAIAQSITTALNGADYKVRVTLHSSAEATFMDASGNSFQRGFFFTYDDNGVPTASEIPTTHMTKPSDLEVLKLNDDRTGIEAEDAARIVKQYPL